MLRAEPGRAVPSRKEDALNTMIKSRADDVAIRVEDIEWHEESDDIDYVKFGVFSLSRSDGKVSHIQCRFSLARNDVPTVCNPALNYKLVDNWSQGKSRIQSERKAVDRCIADLA